MRLSEAIRLGAMFRPQSFGFFFDAGKSCALGAALEAVGVRYGAFFKAELIIQSYWGWTSIFVQCPVCASRESVRTIIARLNNEHRWTREEIADWVATVEPADECRESPAAVDAVDPIGERVTG